MPMTPEPLHLIEVGCNLAHRDYDSDRPAVLERAAAAGVRALVVTGTDLRGSRRALEIARDSGPVALYATCGVHPHNASSWERDAAQVAALARDPLVVAVGECGLDFDRNFSPRPAQERAFAAQVELAIETGKPLFLHERAAHARFLSVLDDYRDHGTLPVPAVVHCFTGTPEAVRAYLDRGMLIGVTGWVCDDRRNRDLLRALPLVPLARLLLETDAPFLRPPGLLGDTRRNEPCNLPHVLRRVASVLRKTPAEVAAATTANAVRFFRLPAAPTPAKERA